MKRIERFEKKLYERVNSRFKGDAIKGSEYLGVTVKTFKSKLRKYDLTWKNRRRGGPTDYFGRRYSYYEED